MAILSSTLTPAGSNMDVVASLAATTAVAGFTAKTRLFAINATGDINISFGNAGMANASASNFRIPAGSMAVYDLGTTFTQISIFNPGAGSINYFIQYLSPVG